MPLLNSSTFHCIDYPSAVWKTHIEVWPNSLLYRVYNFIPWQGVNVAQSLSLHSYFGHTFKIWRSDWIFLCPDLQGSFPHHNTMNTMLSRIFLFLVISYKDYSRDAHKPFPWPVFAGWNLQENPPIYPQFWSQHIWIKWRQSHGTKYTAPWHAQNIVSLPLLWQRVLWSNCQRYRLEVGQPVGHFSPNF